MLREDGILIPTTYFEAAQQAFGKDAAAKSKDYIRRHWKYYEPAAAKSARQSNPEELFERIQSHSLCISGMAFQDAWNIDLERLQRCCIHVVTPEGGLIPFCAYYMTDISGGRLIDQSRNY